MAASWPLVNVSPTSWETLQSFSQRAAPAQHTFLLLGTAFPIARLWGMPPPLRNSHPSAPIQVPSESVRPPHPPSAKDMLLGPGWLKTTQPWRVLCFLLTTPLQPDTDNGGIAKLGQDLCLHRRLTQVRCANRCPRRKGSYIWLHLCREKNVQLSTKETKGPRQMPAPPWMLGSVPAGSTGSLWRPLPLFNLCHG